jgi:hypothetical protein
MEKATGKLIRSMHQSGMSEEYLSLVTGLSVDKIRSFINLSNQ